MKDNLALTLGAITSFCAALAHIGIIIGGPNWYRFFGAGEVMAKMAEQGRIQPVIITAGIAVLLGVFGVYALSAAGIIGKLPLLKIALVMISIVYLIRATAGFVLPFISSHPAISQNSVTFWLISSSICLVMGLLHIFGTIKLYQ
ncbi:hypothetical protein [Paraglaciecola sp. L3A3]|uniref:hypothetical protein n=1 Tax=Paraglaciecola sp. L3A3 TaxID=2686358 RepID=UPI00131D9EFC|nr:hypothetical protein [Paraglaciecola sp. L3A3]